jgi:hypothetical protein
LKTENASQSTIVATPNFDGRRCDARAHQQGSLGDFLAWPLGSLRLTLTLRTAVKAAGTALPAPEC